MIFSHEKGTNGKHGKQVQKFPASDRASGKAWLGGLEWPGWAVVAAARAPGVPQPEQAGWGKFPPQTRHAGRGGGAAGPLPVYRRISDSDLPREIPPSS